MNEEEFAKFLSFNKMVYCERYLHMESVYYLNNLLKKTVSSFLRNKILNAINHKLAGL
jgi:hypothetical protein